MPTDPSHHHHHHRHRCHRRHLRRRSFPMAVALDPHPWGFKPPLPARHCRLRSLPFSPLDPDPDAEPDPDHTSSSGSSSKQFPNFHRSHSTPCFPTVAAYSANRTERPLNRVGDIKVIAGHHAPASCWLIAETAVSLALGTTPIPVDSRGLGGCAFYLHSCSGNTLAVLKPAISHDAGAREVAAYLLDHGGFSGVPPTALLHISRSIASVQRFVPHDFDSGELGPSWFSVSSVHRIGILDVRLLNIDRHTGNILVKKLCTADKPLVSTSTLELVPIDHGLCLPELLDDPYFEWLHWPQSSIPFSEAELEYILALDPYRDVALLQTELPWFKESALRILVLCTVFLKRAAEAGLCLADIGGMMSRELFLEEHPSVLESLCIRTGAFYDNETSEEDGDRDEDQTEETQFEMEDDQVGGVSLLLQRERAAAPLKQEEFRGVTKSRSCSAAELECEGGAAMAAGRQRHHRVSFGGWSEEEWRVFIGRFEELLAEAFEAWKSAGVSQRLGTSCKF